MSLWVFGMLVIIVWCLGVGHQESGSNIPMLFQLIVLQCYECSVDAG